MKENLLPLLLMIMACMVIVAIDGWRAYFNAVNAFKEAFWSWRWDVGGYSELPPMAYDELLLRVEEAVKRSNTGLHLTARGRRMAHGLLLVIVVLLSIYVFTGGK